MLMRKRKYDPICSFEGCDRDSRRYGLCIGHAEQQLKGKELTPLRPRQIRPRGLPCVVCGGQDYRINNTQYCSERCKYLRRTYGESIPVSYECGSCGAETPYEREDMKRRPSYVRLCSKCQRRKQLTKYVSALAERDGTDCRICHEALDITKRGREDDSVSVDHIVPVSLGGGDELENLRLAHLGCNRKRSNNIETKEVA